jgi:hypothetical protein
MGLTDNDTSNNSSIVACIRYHDNISTEPLPGNDNMTFTEPLPSNDTGDTQTHTQHGNVIS